MLTRTLVVALTYVLLPIIVFASDFQNPLALKFIVDILKGFVLAVIYVGTPALVVLIVWTGFLFVSAVGNPDGITKAKATAVQVTIGGFILLSLWVIVRIVGNTLAGLSSAALLIILSGFLLYALYRKK